MNEFMNGSTQETEKAEMLSNEKIRADWLKAMYTYLLGTLLIWMGSYFYVAYSVNIEVANTLLVEVIAGILATALPIAAMFYFAYVKFGTKWIGWFVYVSPITNLLSIIKDLHEVFYSSEITSTGMAFTLTVNFLSACLFVYFWVNCHRLYVLNGNIKGRKHEKKEEAFERIETV